MLWNFIAVAIGGAVGACSRYALSLAMNQSAADGKWPLGTFVANILGCLIIGVLIALVDREKLSSEFWQKVLLTGFVGSLTTFSTFSAESILLFKKQQYSLAGLYCSISLLLGFMALELGRWLVTKIY